MATYLEFLELSASPFDRSGGGRFVLATDALRRTYAEVKRALDEDSPRVCVSGGEGIGKSSLAAALPKLLGDHFLCVSISDPSAPWSHLKAALVKKLDLPDGKLSRSALERARVEGRRLVLIVDQAETIDAESLEHLDTILGYKDERGEQLVQCVLLANLESAPRGDECPLLWWLDRLTTRQLQFSPIPERGVRAYVDKHMKKAGWKGESLFTDEAILAIHRYTGGIPGTVGALCEELLARAAERRMTRIDSDLVRSHCEPDAFGEFAPPDPRREPMLEHPPDEELTTWPELGPRSADPPPRPKPRPRPEPRPQPVVELEEEEELKVEQGFVPMDEPKSGPADFQEFHVRANAPSWGVGPRPHAPTRAPARHGLGRMLRLALCLALAAAAYAYWPDDAPVPKPQLRKMIPPPVAVEPEPLPDDGELTADLRAPDASSAQPREDAPLALPKREASPGGAPALARPTPRAEDQSTAPPASPAPASERGSNGAPTFEPWADEQPDRS